MLWTDDDAELLTSEICFGIVAPTQLSINAPQYGNLEAEYKGHSGFASYREYWARDSFLEGKAFPWVDSICCLSHSTFDATFISIGWKIVWGRIISKIRCSKQHTLRKD